MALDSLDEWVDVLPLDHPARAELAAVQAELAEVKRERDFWKRHLQECTVAAGFEHKESRHAADCAVLVGYRLASAAAVIEGLVRICQDTRQSTLTRRYGTMNDEPFLDRLDAAIASAAAWQGGEHGQ